MTLSKSAMSGFFIALIGLTTASLWLYMKNQGNICYWFLIIISVVLVGAPSAMWWSSLLYKPIQEKEPFDYAISLNKEDGEN